MKAAVYHQYGPPDVLKIAEVEKPRPKANEVLVKIYATSVTSGDRRLRASDFPAAFWLPARLMFGLFKPRNPVLGHECSGVVEAVGESVTQFEPGDEVMASTGTKSGTYAEYICFKEDGAIVPKPQNVTHEEAAVVPIGGTTALFFLKKAGIQSGQKALIYGASGSVGTFGVMLAKHFGAGVTGVCSTSNLDLVKSLGADNVIDYKRENFAEQDAQYDVIFDAVGLISQADCKNVLGPNGVFVSVGKGLARGGPEELRFLSELVAAGELTPVIDKRYSLDEIAEAHRHVDTGHKKGNVAITVATGA